MNNDNTNAPNAKPADAFEAIASNMLEFRKEMEHYDALGTGIASKTRYIMRAVLATLIISSIYLVFMIYQMASNMSIMTGHLEDMYSNFGTMSQDMGEITLMVNSMGKSISGIPEIAQSMTEMDKYVGIMIGSVYEMNTSITAIDNDMVWINLNMQEMTGRLSNMNRSVNLMGYDVNEMAAPMNSGPMSGFWPR